MGWAAAGSVLAVCGYALLFPPFDSPNRALNFAGLLALSLLMILAERSARASVVLARVIGSSPLALVVPVIVNGVIACVQARELFPLHEALTASLLIAVISSTATMTRRATA